MSRPILRCAVYTRVSSDQRLEQDFNSLHAQREAAEAYIKSQSHEGWKLNREHYDDGGFSGGSMERPALQKLLADVLAGRIDVVVVYKVDRLTRSLSDFAKLVETFDANKVSFVSVTQSFNTTSSMGRLTLNVLLSFAQFEREVTGERIRDKIAASKRKGIWMGGVVPLGYRVANRKLRIDESEAETVRLIFQRYLKLGSLPALQRDLLDRGIRSRRRVLASGRSIGDVPMTNGPLAHILRNRLYLGELNHHGASYPSEHTPIVSTALFEAVQAKLKANLNRTDLRRAPTDALLKGRIFDEVGSLMSPSHTTKKGIRYRYYVAAGLVQGRRQDAVAVRRLSAPEVEKIVCDSIAAHVTNEAVDTRLLEQIDLRITASKSALLVSWMSPASSAPGLLREELDAIDDLERHSVVIPYTPVPQTRRREIFLPTSSSDYVRPIEANEQMRLVQAIARGRAWLQELVSGGSIQSIAVREGKSERAIRLNISLAFLDPKLVKATLCGSLPRGVSARRLFDAPSDWHDQWRTIGLCRPL